MGIFLGVTLWLWVFCCHHEVCRPPVKSLESHSSQPKIVATLDHVYYAAIRTATDVGWKGVQLILGQVLLHRKKGPSPTCCLKKWFSFVEDVPSLELSTKIQRSVNILLAVWCMNYKWRPEPFKKGYNWFLCHRPGEKVCAIYGTVLLWVHLKYLLEMFTHCHRGSL